MCILAPDHGFSYHLETPTEATYKQSGEKATRARFDASLLSEDGVRLWNVEFKKGGFSASASSNAIVKDLEKLLVDPGAGAWFHLLERINNGTIRSRIERLRKDVRRVTYNHAIDPRQQLVVHICVLQPAFSVHRTITVREFLDESVLDLEHRIKAGHLTHIQSDGWSILRGESEV